MGVAGDYAKFGLLSYIRRGVNNRIFTNFLNIIQITQLLYNTFPAQNFISRHLRWISDNWSWIKCVGLAPFLTFTALTCWVPSDTYIQYNVSTSPNHYKYWCDFGCFFANNVIRASFRKIRNLSGYYSDNNLELRMAGGNEWWLCRCLCTIWWWL